MVKLRTHLLVFEATEPEVTETLRSYATAKPFKEIDLDVEEFTWLLKMMSPSNSGANHRHCRLYLPLAGPSGFASIFPCHRRGVRLSHTKDNATPNEELLAVSALTDRDVFYFWEEAGGIVYRGYEIYSNGKLKKSVIVAVGDHAGWLTLDGVVIGWPGESRERVSEHEEIFRQPALGDEFFQDQGFSPTLIKWAEETINSALPLQFQGSTFFLSEQFSDFGEYAKYLKRYSNKQLIGDVFAAVFVFLAVSLVLTISVQACIRLFSA